MGEFISEFSSGPIPISAQSGCVYNVSAVDVTYGYLNCEAVVALIFCTFIVVSQIFLGMTVSICYTCCVCGCGYVWVCERPWRDPSGVSEGVAYLYCNRVVENSKFRVKSHAHL